MISKSFNLEFELLERYEKIRCGDFLSLDNGNAIYPIVDKVIIGQTGFNFSEDYTFWRFRQSVSELKTECQNNKSECQNCEDAGAESLHLCPYKSDINGDDETLCNCCSSCCQNCADAI